MNLLSSLFQRSLGKPAFGDETGIVAIDTSALGLKRVDDAAAQELSKVGDYLAYVTVSTYNSKLVTDKQLPAGHIFICQGESNIDCGAETNFVVVTERVKAMRFGAAGEAPMSYFDMHSSEFKQVMKDSGAPNSKAMAGMEFLVWFPDVGETGMFAALFCGNSSLKKEATFLRGQVGGKAVTAKIRQAKNAKGAWVTLTCTPCTTPFGSTPDPVELADQVQKFSNPKSSLVEAATGAGAGRAR